MFKTRQGVTEESGTDIYLRPETAQGIFVNFENVQTSTRKKVPFGIAQIGKSFRNEITPGNFTFRTREFVQMEMQYFVKPGTDAKWFDVWKEERWNYFKRIGLRESKLRFKEHEKLAHYAKAAYDVEYEFPFGWNEIEGIHNRSDFDLSQHAKFSGSTPPAKLRLVKDDERSLNVVFNYNGHSWDAYEVLGLPAGCSPEKVESAYKESLARVEPASRPFMDAAFQAIQSQWKTGKASND